jgi:hypothetical protein
MLVAETKEPFRVVQEYVSNGAPDPVPLNPNVGCAHVSVFSFPASATGAARLDCTTAVVPVVHPFEVFVTIRVYVPVFNACKDTPENVCPPGVIHWYEYPVPLEEPVELIVTAGTAQVIIPLGTADATGGVRLVLTAAIAVLVHPLTLLVTVSV